MMQQFLDEMQRRFSIKTARSCGTQTYSSSLTLQGQKATNAVALCASSLA
jgi:hypothetical protein